MPDNHHTPWGIIVGTGGAIFGGSWKMYALQVEAVNPWTGYGAHVCAALLTAILCGIAGFATTKFCKWTWRKITGHV